MKKLTTLFLSTLFATKAFGGGTQDILSSQIDDSNPTQTTVSTLESEKAMYDLLDTFLDIPFTSIPQVDNNYSRVEYFYRYHSILSDDNVIVENYEDLFAKIVPLCAKLVNLVVNHKDGFKSSIAPLLAVIEKSKEDGDTDGIEEGMNSLSEDDRKAFEEILETQGEIDTLLEAMDYSFTMAYQAKNADVKSQELPQKEKNQPITEAEKTILLSNIKIEKDESYDEYIEESLRHKGLVPTATGQKPYEYVNNLEKAQSSDGSTKDIRLESDTADWENIDKAMKSLEKALYSARDNKNLNKADKNALLISIKTTIQNAKSKLGGSTSRLTIGRVKAKMSTLLNDPTQNNLNILLRDPIFTTTENQS